MFLQDHKSLIFTRIGIFSSELMPAYSASVTSYPSALYDFSQIDSSTKGTDTFCKTSDVNPPII